MLNVEKREPKKPLYVSLYEQMKALIVEGKYDEHQKLPSKRKLGQSLKVSPLTVDAAYQQLIAEGYVYSIEKSGFFVSKRVELVVGTGKRSQIEQKIEEYPKEKFLYEFKTNVVDTSLFPNATWAKLSREVLSENHHEMLNITHVQGMEPLRREISKYLELYRGIKVDVDQIVIGSGSSSLIGIIIEILGRSKHYAMEDPGYSKVYHLFKGNDVELSLIPLDESGISIDHLNLIHPDIVHITPSHQFPSGIVMPIQRRNELLNWANLSQERYIIEDDYDSEFRFQGKPIPALQGLDQNDKVIYMNTFTKTLAPSFRMSYIVLPKKLLNKYKQISFYHGCTVPNFEQHILYKFMNGGYFERHLNRMKNQYREKIEIILNIIKSYPMIHLKGYETGLHFLMEVRTNLSESELVQKALKNKISVTGLSAYIRNQQVNYPIPTLVIGYSGIPTSKVGIAIEMLILSWGF
jgi:GntR family transcriptional regulator / MocR family aminotransferase